MKKFEKNQATSQVVVPEIAINARNNGQIGKWTIGKGEYSSKDISLYIYGYETFFGNFNNSGNGKPPENVLWWQVWFAVVEGEMPKNTVMVTYLKKQSLANLSYTKAKAEAQGLDPAKLLFLPRFEKETKQVAGTQVNYYYLSWDYKECSPEQYESLKLSEEQEKLLSDEAGESKLFPLKDLSNEEIKNLFSKNSIDASIEGEIAQLEPAY